MIKVLGIKRISSAQKHEDTYEVRVLHKGEEKNVVFRATRPPPGKMPITAYWPQPETWAEFDEYDLTHHVRHGKPRGGPDNPVIDEILRLVRELDRGGQVELPATISLTKLRWRRFWHRWRHFRLRRSD